MLLDLLDLLQRSDDFTRWPSQPTVADPVHGATSVLPLSSSERYAVLRLAS